MRFLNTSIGFLILLLFAPLFSGCNNNIVQERHLTADSGCFILDDSLFVIASAGFDYARTPADYWDSRMRLLRSMGVNTVSVRVPWMLHEPQEGVFDFDGENDVAEFCRLARKNDLLVWLHIGPLSDEHMDFGGLPWWLLKYDNMSLRITDKDFMDRVGRYFRSLGEQLAGEQLCNGGALAMIQLDSPYMQADAPAGYLAALRDSAVAAGFSNTLFSVAATKENIPTVALDGAVIAVSMDNEQHATKNFTGIKKLNPLAPIICYDVNRHCQHAWGVDNPPRNWNKNFMRLFETFSAEGSVNLGCLVGGTSFGNLPGAVYISGKYVPYSSAYDNDAIIKDNGGTTDEIGRFTKLFTEYATQGAAVAPDAPSLGSVNYVKSVPFTHVSPLFASLPEAVRSAEPLTMEQCDMGYGAVLYTTEIPELEGEAVLNFEGIRDFARVFVGGECVAAFERSDEAPAVRLQPSDGKKTLSILVDAMGRAAVSAMSERKGLGAVFCRLADGTVKNFSSWQQYPMPADYSFVSARDYIPLSDSLPAGVYRTTFDKEQKNDIYIDVCGFGRGTVWVNGHNLGRYWNRGPQQTLYVPECWLRNRGNELVVLDWVGPQQPCVNILNIRKL